MSAGRSLLWCLLGLIYKDPLCLRPDAFIIGGSGVRPVVLAYPVLRTYYLLVYKLQLVLFKRRGVGMHRSRDCFSELHAGDVFLRTLSLRDGVFIQFTDSTGGESLGKSAAQFIPCIFIMYITLLNVYNLPASRRKNQS